MNRRNVLAGAGIVFAGLAGCTGGTSDRDPNGSLEDGTTETISTGTESQRLTVGETAEYSDGTSLTVTHPTIQGSIIADHSTFLAIERKDRLQYVVIDVDGDAAFEPSSFALERNGAVERPPQTQHRIRSVIRECVGTCIAIPVTAGAVDSAAIAYRSDDEHQTYWNLNGATVAALSEAPDLQLQNAVITDHEGGVGIELTVENSGERGGVFLALVVPVWMADVEDPIGFTVPEGETVTEIVVPREFQQITPGEAVFAEEPEEDTRRFEIEKND